MTLAEGCVSYRSQQAVVSCQEELRICSTAETLSKNICLNIELFEKGDVQEARYNFIVLLGDLNACVGYEVIKDMVGKHDVPGRNKNGE